MGTLLLADDHALVGQTLAAYLQGQGVAQVSVACDVDTALELISQFGSFDLALVDYNMPGMNGLHGFVRILEANGGRPVALISGALSAELADQALQAGAAGVVPKTLGAKALRDAVRGRAQRRDCRPGAGGQRRVDGVDRVGCQLVHEDGRAAD